jgi:hypothetical protein
MSVVLGTNTPQEAAMDPDIAVGVRKHFTSLDAGAMTDIGWTVVAPMFNSADFNRDSVVNGSDLPVWRTAFKNNANADADGDGDSDGRDFLLWQRRLGQTGAVPTATNVVPEPTGVVLLGWIAALLARRLRRVRPGGAMTERLP